MEFKHTTPCGNCPYRKNAPIKYWSIMEFAELIYNDRDKLGKVYGCHKKDNTVCRGFLMNQDKRNFPSIMTRLHLTRLRIDRKYLDQLHCKGDMYESIEEMAKANYPEFFNKKSSV